MLSFIKSWLGKRANPIGVDFGSDSLRLAQVALVENEYRLVAAASADVPSHVRRDPAARMQFFVQTTRDLLTSGGFSGRAAVLALPVASMFIQHLRLPKMDDEAIKKAIPWEARGKLPIDPTHALIRHHIAGEVYQEQETKNEVILMAAGRDVVNQFLSMAGRAHLDVVGMSVEPKVIVDCFNQIYRRKSDAEVTNCYIDIGSSGTRAIVARGGHILFARAIPIGGEHFTRVVGAAMGMTEQDAKLLRLQLCNLQPAPAPVAAKAEMEAPTAAPVEGFAMLDAALAAAGKAERRGNGVADPARREVDSTDAAPVADSADKSRRVDAACRDLLNKLIDELDLCRQYHETTFSNHPIERLIFVGGEARNRGFCQYIAQGLGIAAQVGDPLARMGRVSEIGIESGIDRRQPQPNWTVAIGLSLVASSVENREAM